MKDNDRGQGNTQKCQAADLDRQKKEGVPTLRICGTVLNEMFGTTVYQYDAWYVVTDKGVKKL